MKLLCNLPLECFEDRLAYPDVELCTYGPADRMVVDGIHYPFDVAFDPASGTLEELLRSLPQGFYPDAIIIYWPDQEPLPKHLEESPVPVIGIVSDYNLSLPFLVGLWPFFDMLLVDRMGVGLFERLSFAEPRYFCQYTFKAPNHRIYPDVVKDLDVAFAGNLNPVVQSERAPWMQRLRDLSAAGLRVEVRNDVHGEAYGRFLNRTQLGFNRSIRSEMNLRAFEVPACGAALLMEADNQEVRDFFVPDHEVVLYTEEDFEDTVRSLLGDPARCQAIAAAGHRRVQDFRLSHRLRELCGILSARHAERPPSSALDCALGRGTAMLSTWARGRATFDDLLEACRLAPEDPRPRNNLALALLRENQDEHGVRAVNVLRSATGAADSTYVPALFNLTWLYASCDHPETASLRNETLRRLENPTFADLDGLMLPFGYSTESIAKSLALADAVRHHDPQRLATALRNMLPEAPQVGAPNLGALV